MSEADTGTASVDLADFYQHHRRPLLAYLTAQPSFRLHRDGLRRQRLALVVQDLIGPRLEH